MSFHRHERTSSEYIDLRSAAEVPSYRQSQEAEKLVFKKRRLRQYLVYLFVICSIVGFLGGAIVYQESLRKTSIGSQIYLFLEQPLKFELYQTLRQFFVDTLTAHDQEVPTHEVAFVTAVRLDPLGTTLQHIAYWNGTFTPSTDTTQHTQALCLTPNTAILFSAVLSEKAVGQFQTEHGSYRAQLIYTDDKKQYQLIYLRESIPLKMRHANLRKLRAHQTVYLMINIPTKTASLVKATLQSVTVGASPEIVLTEPIDTTNACISVFTESAKLVGVMFPNTGKISKVMPVELIPSVH